MIMLMTLILKIIGTWIIAINQPLIMILLIFCILLQLGNSLINNIGIRFLPWQGTQLEQSTPLVSTLNDSRVSPLVLASTIAIINHFYNLCPIFILRHFICQNLFHFYSLSRVLFFEANESMLGDKFRRKLGL